MSGNWELVATVWDDELEKAVDITLAVVSGTTDEVPWDVLTFEIGIAHLRPNNDPRLKPRFVDGWTFPKFVVYRVEEGKKAIVESRYP